MLCAQWWRCGCGCGCGRGRRLPGQGAQHTRRSSYSVAAGARLVYSAVAKLPCSAPILSNVSFNTSRILGFVTRIRDANRL